MSADGPLDLQIDSLLGDYDSGALRPEDVLGRCYERIARQGTRPIWIELLPLAAARALLESANQRRARGEILPLYGVPFAVKDNIDLGGQPTTAACPEYRYVPSGDAAVVARLIDAGAIPVGKTNMDQFATGLVGTRSPFGACSNAFDPRYIAGGSSSGSALAVAHGLVSFALGTDTAGSGRVPAAFNNIVGLKPSRGLVSTRGVVPACSSLDCVSVFACSAADAARVFSSIRGFDRQDPFSRSLELEAPRTGQPFVFGVLAPADREFFGNSAYERGFERALDRLQALGGTPKTIDFAPLQEAASLLYGGPWVAERYAAVGEFIDSHRDAIDPSVREIITGGKRPTAAELFSAIHRLEALRRDASLLFKEVDVLLLPTAGTLYTREEIEREPLNLNANLGRYTNFVNLLDLAAVAVPAEIGPAGLPFGVTLIGRAGSDLRLLDLAADFHASTGLRVGATPSTLLPRRDLPPSEARREILLAVVGAHLSGQPLNSQLSSRSARLVRTCKTSSAYRLYALPNTTPPKPGLALSPGFSGAGIELEVWALGEAEFGSFVADVPPPMTIGTVTLDDESKVKCFFCEPYALEGATEITAHGGWRAYLAALQKAKDAPN